MHTPDLTHWLETWRTAADTLDEDGDTERNPVEPLVVFSDDRWTVLSPTATPHTLRVDVMLDEWPHDELAAWLFDEMLRWSFENAYVDEALQFTRAPDGTLVACTHLAIAPEENEALLLERLSDAVDQVDDAWALVVAQTLIRAHDAELAERQNPQSLAA